MQLIDVATVTDGGATGWMLGEEISSRECAVDIALVTNVCENDAENQLVDGGVGGLYTTRPVGLIGTLHRPLGCWQDDDPEWLNGTLKDTLDYALSRALVSVPAVGANSAGAVWVGATGTWEQTFATVPGTMPDPLAYADAIMEARQTWYSHVATKDKPILHVSPRASLGLARAGLLHVIPGSAREGEDDGEVVTLLGDDVVISPGYDAAHPIAFWTGPIKVTISSAESTGKVPNARSNQAAVTSTLVAMFDLPPCSIVRVGAAPA
jgi:hypothetical protein